MKNKALAILMIVALMLPTTVLADPGSLTGTVLDSNNVPIPNVLVEVQGVPGASDTSSDPDGIYLIDPLADGTYTLNVTPPPEDS